MHWLSQRDCLSDERLWKIYWWGGHRDEALVRKLDLFPRLIQLPKHLPGVRLQPGSGFGERTTVAPSGWLKKYRELPSKDLIRYGPQPLLSLRSVPDNVDRKGQEAIYSGPRLLVARGIKSGGFITSRLENEEYCFRNSIHGVRFEGLEEWQELVIAGIFWSSLARYFYFTTSGSWGFWHDEIHLEDVEQMPICFPTGVKLRNRIVKIVEELQQLGSRSDTLFPNTDVDELAELEDRLNTTVFDLYDLTTSERDLVLDKCSIGMDLFYQHHKGTALQKVVLPSHSSGILSDLPQSDQGLSAYLRTFLEVWNAELAPDGEFAWAVMSPPSHAPLLAVRFTTRYKNGRPVTRLEAPDSASWASVLADLQKHALVPGTARIFVDTFFRYVSDREILFIKRNERRFWTRTAAREDAESALAHLMNLEDVGPGGKQ